MYGGNKRKNAWMQELLDVFMLPLMYTLEVVEVEDEWRNREIAWIQTYQEQGADLLNDEAQPFDRVLVKKNQKEAQTAYKLSLVDLPDFKLDADGDLNAFDATDSEFMQFVQTLVPLTGDNLDHWTWEERRDFLNWCLDEHVLVIQDGRLVPYEENTPTASLRHDDEGTGFLDDVEHARPVITSNPAISAKELADALGLTSTVYAQSLKVSVNAHKSAQEGA
jgi:hypothetical protein